MKKVFALFTSTCILFLLIATTFYGIMHIPNNKQANNREVLKKIHNEIELSIIEALHKNESKNIELKYIDISIPDKRISSKNNNCGIAILSLEKNTNEVFNEQNYSKRIHHKNKLLNKYFEYKLTSMYKKNLKMCNLEIRMIFKLDKKATNKFEIIPLSTQTNDKVFTSLRRNI
jgi:hypothetical protein